MVPTWLAPLVTRPPNDVARGLLPHLLRQGRSPFRLARPCRQNRRDCAGHPFPALRSSVSQGRFSTRRLKIGGHQGNLRASASLAGC